MSVLGIGIDLVDVARARHLLERHGARILARTLTDTERTYVVAGADPAQAFAARLAAKEAAYKALQALDGARGIAWRDLEVVRDPGGRPSLALHGLAARLVAANMPLRLRISLTHSHTSAAAVVLVEALPSNSD